MVRHKRYLYYSEDEGTKELVEFLKKPKLPKGDAHALAFIMKKKIRTFLLILPSLLYMKILKI